MGLRAAQKQSKVERNCGDLLMPKTTCGVHQEVPGWSQIKSRREGWAGEVAVTEWSSSASHCFLTPPPPARHWTMLTAQAVSTTIGFVVDVSNPFFFPS